MVGLDFIDNAGLSHIPPKGESRALGYSEFASLAKRVHTTGGMYGDNLPKASQLYRIYS